MRKLISFYDLEPGEGEESPSDRKKQKIMTTKQKYLFFLKDLYSTKKFRSTEISKKHNVSSSIIPILADIGVCRKIDRGIYEWITKEVPSNDIVDLIIEVTAERNAHYIKLRKEKEKKKEQQNKISMITEEEAIACLKASTSYEYEIYRTEKIKL